MIKVTTTPHVVGEKAYRQTEQPVLTGAFKHNRNFPFRVWVNPDGSAALSATAIVIQAESYNGLGQTGPLPTAAHGDLIEVDGELYRILDDKIGYDPRLLKFKYAG